jgi:hypothetical protein
MPARKSRPVRYLVDAEAVPPRRREVMTRTAHALAFWLGGTYHPDRPDHAEGALLTAAWGVIQHGAPADAEPVLVTYDRGAVLPFGVDGQADRHTQLGDAMEAAVGWAV